MKKTLSGFLLFCLTLIYAQVKFEKGYIINNDNVKTEVLIKNKGWASNPDNISYKSEDSSEEITGTPSTIKEFGIYNDSKYVSYNGDMDRSPDDISNLSNSQNPQFTKSSVFLKEVTSGARNLYSYKSFITRYFYSGVDLNIHPLIYKKYFSEGNKLMIATNDEYIDQLKNIFSDDKGVQAQANNAQYTTQSLTKLFKAYNGKIQPDSNNQSNNEIIIEKKKEIKFNLTIRPGINFYSPLKLEDSFSNPGFSSKTNFRIGVEAELILPFNRNKWSLIIEPTFSQYSNKRTSVQADNGLYNIAMDNYSFISIPLGVRHHMYLNDKSKIFIDASINLFNIKTSSSSTMEIEYNGYVFDKLAIANSHTFRGSSFGIGYNYNNKYSIEGRINTPVNILDKDLPYANIKYFSLILGYNIF
ncbi:hypothetical protein C1637_23135 [Chryseobacterium lactis]|uniref:PorT family protein n=1 Tax=Chryseobacterium lactis TaxID=1241981 RepID=A0A3G6RU82_CHRLC|nr:hypothetical protein [Chryseobacterium lactis]AZA80434.1 hypothetical protein EG342_00200 [Chryseobacterium lactis]AZB05436.1 hypothetical protein EG341_16325 [Chryseobacterium lactis]PNW11429.1 hypothetical protein C1637_23135 [Chryseobacterium lactis]